jgi:chromosome segregation ATPase
MFKPGVIPAEGSVRARRTGQTLSSEDGVRMELIRKLTGSRMIRLGWGIAALALVAVLALTFIFAWSAIGEEQRGAQARAVGFTTRKPLSTLSPSLVSKPIHADSYSQLIRDSKARILSDPRVIRIRIWNLGGTLVFSTDTVDKISVAQTIRPQFKTAASGGVASLMTESRTPAGGGLDGSSERLYVTFAALRLDDQARPAAVVEVEQRYAAIKAAAYQLWRPVQLVVGVLLLVSLAMLGLGYIAGRAPIKPSTPVVTPGPGFTQPPSSRVQKELESRVHALEDSLRAAESRVASTEREKRQIAERLVSAHEQLELMTAAAKSGGKSDRGDGAVSKKLIAVEQERDRLADELERLRATVDERKAAQHGEGDVWPGGEEDPAARIEELEAALVDATAKAHSMESAAKQVEEERKLATSELERLKQSMAKHDSETRRLKEELAARRGDAGSNDSILAVEASTRLAEAEEQLRHSGERSMQAENRAAQAEERLRLAEERASQAEERLKQSQQWVALAEDAEGQAEAKASQAEERARFAQGLLREADENLKHAQAELKRAEERANELGADAHKAEAKLSHAEERARSSEARAKQFEEDLKRVHKELAAAERQAGDSTTAAQQAAASATKSEERVRYAEERLKQAEQELKRAQDEVTRAEQRGGDAQRSEERLVQLQARLVQLEGGDKDAERRAVHAEQRLAQLQAVTGQADERMTQLETSSRQAEQRMAQEEVRLKELEEERARLAAELERVLAAGDEANAARQEAGGDGEGRIAQLAGRIEQLETERRRDVSELQRVQEALANTQLELTAATKRANEAEARVRKLEGSGRSAPPVEDETIAEPLLEDAEIRVPTSELFARPQRKARAPKNAEDLAPEHEEETIAARLTKIRGKKSEAEPEQSVYEPDPVAAEVTPEGLSLRERLARAAAARHRSTGGSDDGGSR